MKLFCFVTPPWTGAATKTVQSVKGAGGVSTTRDEIEGKAAMLT
ncbi:MAG TPA: hypothetical protein VLA64_15290 [Azonexus sp.]|nr:hypothetical protein [Azonexus sp.]